MPFVISGRAIRMEPAGGGGTGRQSRRRGRYYEDRARALLEQRGYLVTKSGGSLGVFDLVAIGAEDVKAIQVKGGKRPRLRSRERDVLAAVRVPPNVSKELWLFHVRNGAPRIEVL